MVIEVDFKLYLITDRRSFTDKDSFINAIEDSLKAGVKAVQLRERDLNTRELLELANKMRELTKKYHVKLFINDRVDIALSVDADGVHIGQKSIPAHAVRKIVQEKLIIGVSTHSLDEALEAERDGADFITLGPIYETISKLKYGKPIGVDTLKRVKSKLSMPVFGIGGIKLDKVREVKETGADGIALISAILASKDIRKTTEDFLRLLNQNEGQTY
ncbi:MAG: thiamine phosphate synthase [Nitrospirota bacterium]|nr:thiamine phosphate synthase [Nitrospirota bacterium]